jgi:ArsR family transcriptional regulator
MPLAGSMLSEEEALELEQLFDAVADKHRIRILNLLLTAEDAVCVCEFVPTLGLSQATVSYHLKQLTQAGLLVKERRSYYVYYRIAPEALERLRALLAPKSRLAEAV